MRGLLPQWLNNGGASDGPRGLALRFAMLPMPPVSSIHRDHVSVLLGRHLEGNQGRTVVLQGQGFFMFRLHFKGVGLPILPQVIEGEIGRWSSKVVLNMGRLQKNSVINAVYCALCRKEPGWGVAFGRDHRGNWYLRYPSKHDHDEPGGIMVPVYGRFGSPSLDDAKKIVDEYLSRM